MDTSDKSSNSELKSKVQITKQKKINDRYEPNVALDDTVYLETYYSHQLGSVAIDKNPTKMKAQELHIIGWTLIKTQ